MYASEIRKEANAIDVYEFALLYSLIREGRFVMTDHLAYSMMKRRISECKVAEVLQKGQIVCFSYIEGDCRVTLREARNITHKAVYVVLSLTTFLLLTAFRGKKVRHFAGGGVSRSRLDIRECLESTGITL